MMWEGGSVFIQGHSLGVEEGSGLRIVIIQGHSGGVIYWYSRGLGVEEARGR